MKTFTCRSIEIILTCSLWLDHYSLIGARIYRSGIQKGKVAKLAVEMPEQIPPL
jgi:hypothetical protein